jgi:hypothetical protein
MMLSAEPQRPHLHLGSLQVHRVEPEGWKHLRVSRLGAGQGQLPAVLAAGGRGFSTIGHQPRFVEFST